MTVSVIGCVVNGPGEARETDIGFTGGGNGTHQVYVNAACPIIASRTRTSSITWWGWSKSQGGRNRGRRRGGCRHGPETWHIATGRFLAQFRRLFLSALQPVRGTRDILPEEMRRHQRGDRYGRGYRWPSATATLEMSTPVFEFTEVFKRSLGDTSDVVTKEMYTFAMKER